MLQTVHDPEVLLPVVQALGTMADVSRKLQASLGNTQGLIASLVAQFETNNHPGLMLALTNAVSSIAKGDKANQTSFVNEGITSHIVNVVMHQIRNKEIQVSWRGRRGRREGGTFLYLLLSSTCNVIKNKTNKRKTI